jgi:hypothetical protein
VQPGVCKHAPNHAEEAPPSVVSHHCGDVLFQQAGHLDGREVASHRPFGMLWSQTRQCANLHPVSLRETDDLIALAEVECAFVLAHHPPLHRVLRFDHVDFAGQSSRVRSLGKQRDGLRSRPAAMEMKALLRLRSETQRASEVGATE